MSRQWRILVVDDDPIVCRSMAAWLTEDGHRVDTAASGEQAIELVLSERYAICFIDLKMPGGIDGLQTMREIRERRPDAACVIITAYAAIDTAVTAMKEGAVEYIVKPCNWNLLESSSWLNFYLGRDHTAKRLGIEPPRKKSAGKVEEQA